MELSQHGFLEELLQAQRRDHHTWATLPTGVNDFSNGWSFDSFEEATTGALATPSSNPSFADLLSSTTNEPTPNFGCPFTSHHQASYPFVDTYTVVPEIDTSSYTKNDHYPSLVDQDEDRFGLFGSFEGRNSTSSGCKVEMEQGSNNIQVDNVALCGEKSSGAKSKKLEGQPSKNLMAERRRRKRLNDRLSMLRSIVPKISKMDRTSILGDTIDYMKELLERVNKLQEEGEEGTNQMSLVRSLKEIKPNESLVRNSPKFDVERREMDARIDICCAAKPGLLLSTVSSLEALGLEIQHCVISCFNDFSMQASCSEEDEQRTLISSEDLKQALLRTAGYGGRYL